MSDPPSLAWGGDRLCLGCGGGRFGCCRGGFWLGGMGLRGDPFTELQYGGPVLQRIVYELLNLGLQGAHDGILKEGGGGFELDVGEPVFDESREVAICVCHVLIMGGPGVVFWVSLFFGFWTGLHRDTV